MAARDELVFLPLGGVGEIGMNLALYGYGPPHDRTWLAVDFGVAFAHADLPGVDLIFPDIAYLEEERTNLAGIVITHAHEDHFGALIDLWPRLRVPVYATAFTADLLAAKIASEPGAEPVPVTIVAAGRAAVRSVRSTSSTSTSRIRSRSRTPSPSARRSASSSTAATGSSTRRRRSGRRPTTTRLRAIGDEGVLALICDSTNAMREGRSPSETEVGAGGRRDHRRGAGAGRLHHLCVQCRPPPVDRPGRAAAGRDVVVVGPGDAAGDRRGARARHARRRAAVPRRGGLRVPAARQGRGASDRQPGRAARRAVAGRRRRASAHRPRRRATRWSSRRARSPATSSRSTRIVNRAGQPRHPRHHRPRPVWFTSPAIRGATSCARCTPG